jgi:hypothetical protein
VVHERGGIDVKEDTRRSTLGTQEMTMMGEEKHDRTSDESPSSMEIDHQ